MTTAAARRSRARVPALAAAGALLLAALPACTAAPSQRAAPSPSSTTPTTTTSPATTPPSTTSSPTTTATPSSSTRATSCAERVVAGLDTRGRAGQLLMVGLHSGGSSAALGTQVADQRLGSVILLGNWGSGVSGVRSATSTLRRSASAAGLPGLLVAADQEGGQVQRLQGPGFTRIPSAREQGTLGPTVLRQRAAGWSRQLARAGVDVNLAPVADTVPRSLGDANEPIGALDRDFVPGSPRGNGTLAAAFVRGSLDGGVVPAVKHFPGIGRLRSNTDFSATGITDPVTSATDPYLAPFRAAVAAGSPVVMMSSARYPRLDPDRQALFSPRIVTGLLRGDLGFGGVVVTDDVGAADSVAAVPVGERATRVVAAGGDIVLTAEPSQAATMIDALVDRARTEPAFAARLRASATRVVALKARAGLVRCG